MVHIGDIPTTTAFRRKEKSRDVSPVRLKDIQRSRGDFSGMYVCEMKYIRGTFLGCLLSESAKALYHTEVISIRNKDVQWT